MRNWKLLAFTSMLLALIAGTIGCGGECASGGNCPANGNGGNNGGLPPSPPAGSGGIPTQPEIDKAVAVFAGAGGIGQTIHDNTVTDCASLNAALTQVQITCDTSGTGNISFSNCQQNGSVLTVTATGNFNNCADQGITSSGDFTETISYDSSNPANPVVLVGSSSLMTVDNFTYATNNFTVSETESPNPQTSTCSGNLVYNNLSCTLSSDCSTCN